MENDSELTKIDILFDQLSRIQKQVGRILPQKEKRVSQQLPIVKPVHPKITALLFVSVALLTFLFVCIDYLMAAMAWGIFYFLRKEYVEKVDFYPNPTFYAGVLLVPVVWIFIYFMQGTYHDVRRMYRSRAMVLSFFGSVLGTFVLFFTFLIDDEITGGIPIISADEA